MWHNAWEVLGGVLAAFLAPTFTYTGFRGDGWLARRNPRFGMWVRSYRAVVALWLTWAALTFLAVVAILVIGTLWPGRNPTVDYYGLAACVLPFAGLFVWIARKEGLRVRDRGV